MNDVDPRDEAKHEPGPEPLWSESWYFDFFAPDGSVGGWVRLGLYPNLGVSWYHAYVVRPGERTLAIVDVEAPLPRAGASLELRSHGLWADHTCETPLEHWSLGNEAFGLSVDDPADLYEREPRGEQVPVGLDLEWETDGVPYHYLHTTRYEIPCRVHGEVLIGDQRIELDGWGQRDHSWGVRDWWVLSWVWCSGRLEDGLRFHGADIRIPGADVGFGYVQPGDGSVAATNVVHAREVLGAHGFPAEASIEIGELDVALEVLALAPALLVGPGGQQSRFPRALCRVRAAGGRTGLAWTEWNQPQP